MKRKYLFILFSLFLFLSLSVSQAQDRKTVAVVLSGGGAKGVAHVPVLKAIERAGIPVDIVVGTSMGSLVGGLYATGYNADQLDSIIQVQNWTNLLTDQQDRTSINYDLRQKWERYLLRASFSKSPFEVVKGGVLKGNNVAMLLSTLTADHQDSISYNKLPRRYACVATDIMTGKEVDIHSGILAESMRASMAIPGAFAPVKKGKMVLVDGGLCNNYPVDVARKMGADIVIGVNVGGTDTITGANIDTPMDVLSQLLGNLCSKKTEENIQNTDLYIPVDVTGYNAASFTKTAIDTLLDRGNKAALEHWTELIQLRHRIGLPEVTIAELISAAGPKPKHLSYSGTVIPPATIYDSSKRDSYIGLGVRFDREELVSMLVGGSYQFWQKRNARVGLDIRLGKRSYGDLDLSIRAFEKWMATVNYRLLFNDMEIYMNGASAADVMYTENLVNLHFSRSWRMMKLSVGAEFTYRHFTKANTNEDLSFLTSDLSNERNYKYYLQLEYDNMNSTQYPTKGIRWNIRYNFFTTNGANYEGGAGLHIVDGYYQMAIPFSRSTTFLPYIAARSLSSRNSQFSNMNVIGGIDHYGFYMPQQLSFAGVNYIEVMDNNIAILGFTLRQRITKNNYVFAVVNALTEGDKLKDIFSRQYYGGAIGYGYKTPVGPIEFNLNWSNRTNRLGWYLSFGYNF